MSYNAWFALNFLTFEHFNNRIVPFYVLPIQVLEYFFLQILTHFEYYQ